MIFFILIAFLLILCMISAYSNLGNTSMNKTLFYAFLSLLPAFGAVAAEPTYLEEVKSLGFVSGQGLACQASKYDTFELLARAILISKAQSDDMQEQGMRAFNEGKAEAFISKIRDNMSDCAQINRSFDNQQIFKAVLYGDGTIKMPDGKLVKPRHAYDATLVYKKDPNARDEMIKLYQTQHNKILNDPNYKKALRERQARDGF